MKEIKPVRTHCLSNDELEKLLYHPDSIENQSILLDHISGCELCSDAYDGMKTLNEEEYHKHLIQLKEKIKDRLGDSKKRILPLRKWLTIAASFLILFTLTYYLNQYFSRQQQELAQIPNQKNTDAFSNDEPIAPSDSIPDSIKPDVNTTGPVLMNPENTKDIRKDDKMFREEFKTEDIQSTQQTGANKNIQNQDALKPNNQGKPYVPAPSGTQQPGSEQEDLPSTLYTEKSVTVDDTESLSESVTISTESNRKIKKKQRDGNKLNEAPIVNESSEKNQFQNLTVADSTELYKNIRTEKILQFAQEAYNQNQFQQAISLCNQILLRNDGTEDNALLLKAKCLYKLGDKNSSVQLLQELIKRKSPLSNEAQHIIDSY